MLCSSQSSSTVLYKSGQPLEEPEVEFRLMYLGNGITINGSASEKHMIRRAFHPQLKQLWEVNESLRKLAEIRGYASESDAFTIDKQIPQDEARASFFASMGKRHARGEYHYVPLVEKSVCLRVSLDILFLRRDQHSLVKKSGDIDNRLKTLFDALRIPDVNDGCGTPEVGEDPFFVLLQDDSLISEIRVNTDQLLMLPDGSPYNYRDAALVISVNLKPTQKVRDAWAFD